MIHLQVAQKAPAIENKRDRLASLVAARKGSGNRIQEDSWASLIFSVS